MKTKSFLLVLSICLLACSCQIKKTSNEKNVSEQTLRLGVNNWFFWRSNADGEYSGAEIDIWNEIAKRNGLHIEYVAIGDLQDMKRAMENDSIDAFLSTLKTPEREKYMSFIEPPFRTKVKFLAYVKKGSDIKISRIEDMHGLMAAQVGGGFNDIDKDTLITKKPFYWNVQDGFNMLLKDSVDVVLVNHWLAIWFLRDETYNSQVELTNYSHSEYHPCYMVMSNKSALLPKWEKEFGRTIQEMISDGSMKKIIDSYVPGWYEIYPNEGHE